MKNLLFALFACILFSCSGGGNKEKAITGTWKLVTLENTKDGEAPELKECDKKTIWKFSKDKAEPLGDGTEVMKLKAKAPDGCKWQGFDSKWTVKDGNLYISSTKVGGMGGISNAGMFTIKEINDKKMVLEILRHRYVFEKK